MGCSSSTPPPYTSGPVYENRAQLLWALEVLAAPPMNVHRWRLAYNVATAAVAHAHNLAPQSGEVAVQRPGAIGLAAAQSLRQVRAGGSAVVAAFAVPHNP